MENYPIWSNFQLIGVETQTAYGIFLIAMVPLIMGSDYPIIPNGISYCIVLLEAQMGLQIV